MQKNFTPSLYKSRNGTFYKDFCKINLSPHYISPETALLGVSNRKLFYSSQPPAEPAAFATHNIGRITATCGIKALHYAKALQ